LKTKSGITDYIFTTDICFLLQRAKPPKEQRNENFVLTWRQKEKELLENTKLIKLFDQYCKVYRWQQQKEQKWLNSAVQRKVDSTMQEYLAGIAERRMRLCELLEAEESRYCAEMEALEETTQKKQAKMRERAKLLKEKREEERQQLVAAKQEQQFREQSEELRTLWMKKHQKEVFEDQLVQVALKEELEKQQQKEERMFEELLKEDMLAKEKQEAVKMQKVAEQHRETLNALNAQVAVLRAHKEEAKRLKEEEARLLEEEQQLLKLENEQLQMEKLQKQRECRDMLLSAAQDRKNRLNEEKQVELALEMKILEKALQGPQENIEKARRKQELLKEQKTYLAHLAQQLEEENQRQKEVDKVIDEEIAKIWDKKAEQLKLEKEARKQLLNDVLNTRKLQIEEKLQRNVKKQEELAQEKRLLAEAITELKHTEEEKYARKVKEAKEYQEQLRAQMACRQQARNAEQEEKQRDYESTLEAERAYREKVQDILSIPCEKVAKTHPFRRKLMS
ncbi:cilia- and flagella-associated protein 53, partial [Neopsephotus bourkii]|uniref:cilia- and flagella-associated protein 53 n=1 Tax=Neopsephotus bourkii TaxID=309878 RepID=UPI002AA5A7C8